MPDFTRRSRELELIDAPQSQALWDHAFVFIRRVNRFLGGYRAMLWHFRRWAARWKAGERIVVLDAGCGGADSPQALRRWGRAAGFDLQVVGLDWTPECLRSAKKEVGSEVMLVRGDVERPPVTSVDYVMCSTMFHHLPDPACIRLLRTFHTVARRGVLVVDLIRRRRAWLWATALGRLYGGLSANDAALSVLRSFTLAEARALAIAAEMPWLRVDEFFGHRFTLAGEHPG